MGFSRIEINLQRLLSAAPNQQNQAKLVHYVATMREQLEQLGEERTPDGLPRVSKAKLSEYSEKIEAIASLLNSTQPDVQHSGEPSADFNFKSKAPEIEVDAPTSPGLRRRNVPVFGSRDNYEKTTQISETARLDDAAKAHIERHRKMQEDLTDEMVGLAKQLRERSTMMHQSVRDTEKIVDSTEKAIEQSLATTGRTNIRATEIYSRSSKTSCFTFLLMFIMGCVFIMVVLLIRVT